MEVAVKAGEEGPPAQGHTPKSALAKPTRFVSIGDDDTSRLLRRTLKGASSRRPQQFHGASAVATTRAGSKCLEICEYSFLILWFTYNSCIGATLYLVAGAEFGLTSNAVLIHWSYQKTLMRLTCYKITLHQIQSISWRGLKIQRFLISRQRLFNPLLPDKVADWS